MQIHKFAMVYKLRCLIIYSLVYEKGGYYV